MDDQTVMQAASTAAEAWGGAEGTPRLVLNRENAVLDVRLRSGWRGALRLHRPGYQTREAIRSELRWMESLADAGFACPWPLRTQDEDFIYHTQTGQVVSMLQWLDAAPIGPVERTCASAADTRTALYGDLGALLADLHLTADLTAPRDLIRPSWDARALCCSEAPLWGRFWTHPALDQDEADLLRAARDAARNRLMELGTDGTGLIHADVLQENVLRKDHQLYLIDFDDCGHGYRHYDLATALIQHVDSPEYEALTSALWTGYVDAGGPLPDSARADLPMFVMLRAMASAGWIIDRAPADDPRQSAYAARAVNLARAFLKP
ncbi:MAG: phosphotransferase [Pseudomonadota bacterium]